VERIIANSQAVKTASASARPQKTKCAWRLWPPSHATPWVPANVKHDAAIIDQITVIQLTIGRERIDQSRRSPDQSKSFDAGKIGRQDGWSQSAV
jgi:hypothetical protein